VDIINYERNFFISGAVDRCMDTWKPTLSIKNEFTVNLANKLQLLPDR
jgi:hypothetical protein